MGTKANPTPHGCYEKAEPDEPLFTLIARDPLAAVCVRWWARAALTQGRCSREKYQEAMACADAMDVWRKAHRAHDVEATIRGHKL